MTKTHLGFALFFGIVMCVSTGSFAGALPSCDVAKCEEALKKCGFAEQDKKVQAKQEKCAADAISKFKRCDTSPHGEKVNGKDWVTWKCAEKAELN